MAKRQVTGRQVTGVLTRWCYSDVWGTLGTLIVPHVDGGSLVLYTAENAWRDNRGSVSCIPDGQYRVERYIRPNRKGLLARSWILEGSTVSKAPSKAARFGVLIHIGNTHHDVEGCIVVGMNPGVLNGDQPGVLASGIAMEALDQALADVDMWKLRIVRHAGAPAQAPAAVHA